MGRWLLAAAMLGCLLTGCSTTRFSVVDSTTAKPLNVVEVDGYRFRPQSQIPSDLAWKEVPVPSTDQAGSATSIQPLSIMPGENEYRYVFTKPGYRPAEVLVYSDRTVVASPADDAGWVPVENDPHHLEVNVPTRNFQTFPGHGQITVSLRPLPPQTGPAADSTINPQSTAEVK